MITMKKKWGEEKYLNDVWPTSNQYWQLKMEDPIGDQVMEILDLNPIMIK